ncbi:arginine repressor [Streptococcus panodentis]|uniref:Arginine repressor n=1 Tax=Streptococcus panodentis TaxID=1581472 RepID=A0ABS5AZM9_9STRE|nr:MULTISPECIES: arginine repressor [Streptococcus]KXT85145.1 arginine repressor [Streptococcus sp. DD11]MBP2622049.1 arginine repressor [Streptococcus panodentis]
MRKSDRHQLVKMMIKEEKLGTQKEIQDRLEAQGIYVTQTTLSRDLREIGLTKVKKGGQTYYVLAHETEEIDLIEFLARHIQSVARAEFSLVFRTGLGEATVLANIVDGTPDSRILGTVAGANTLLVICRDQAAAGEIEGQISALM